MLISLPAQPTRLSFASCAFLPILNWAASSEVATDPSISPQAKTIVSVDARRFTISPFPLDLRNIAPHAVLSLRPVRLVKCEYAPIIIEKRHFWKVTRCIQNRLVMECNPLYAATGNYPSERLAGYADC